MSIFSIFKKESTNECLSNLSHSSNESSEEQPTASLTGKETISCVKNSETSKPKETMENQTADNQQKVHNLIILDESGSMQSIYQAAISGVNETIQTIRMAESKHPDQHHYVTLVSFNTVHYNQIYNHISANTTGEITTAQYCPDDCTPLFDAMGRGINELRPLVKEDDVVLVTIITDGYENASTEYSESAIKALVEEMREKGWVFTYIGANQDVDKVAESMAINNRMSFQADMEGTQVMFQKERNARIKFFMKISDRKSMSNKEFEDNFF